MHSFKAVDIPSADITALKLDAAILDNTIVDTIPVDLTAAKEHHTFARPPPGAMLPSQSWKQVLQSLSFLWSDGMAMVLSPIKYNP